jgi:NADPH:quinone reductase
MRAWVVERWGTFDDLVLKDIDVPVLRPGEVLVRVEKAALNFADGIALRGNYQVKVPPPFVLGTEVAGVVVDANDSPDVREGDRVAAQVWSGAYGEYCAVERHRLIRLPDVMSFSDAAALPVSYTTAYVGLFTRGELSAGEIVLIHAAAGGVGMAATQLARSAGARVIATAGSAEKCAIAHENGADHVINYRDGDWVAAVKQLAPKGVNLVFDPVGGEMTNASLRVIGWGGRLMIVGFASGKIADIPANRLLVKAISARGVYWGFETDGDRIAAIQEDLIDRHTDGRIKPRIGGSVPFAELKAGLAALEAGQTSGKIILDMNS